MWGNAGRAGAASGAWSRGGQPPPLGAWSHGRLLPLGVGDTVT
jgi:hypothetical protein